MQHPCDNCGGLTDEAELKFVEEDTALCHDCWQLARTLLVDDLGLPDPEDVSIEETSRALEALREVSDNEA